MRVITKGKVKTVYTGDDAHKVVIEYHDKVTAGNGEKEDYPLGKGSLCCSISSLLFKNDPLLTPDRVRLMGHDPQPFIDITLRINDILRQMFYIMGIDLVDFKVEYGYDAHGDLYLADEISPDSMRLWQTGTNERFDKDLFRNGEGDIIPAYRHILDKLQPLACR